MDGKTWSRSTFVHVAMLAACSLCVGNLTGSCVPGDSLTGFRSCTRAAIFGC